MSKTKVIYGFSGTLKTTIANYHLCKNGETFIESPTKYMEDFNEKVGGRCMEITPMHGLMMRFQALEYSPKPVVIERTIYDYVFFSILTKVDMFDKLTDFNFRELNSREWNLVGDREYYLVVNDSDKFIKDVILKDTGVRSTIYDSYQSYMDRQNEYLSFVSQFIKPDHTLILNDEMINSIFNDETYNLPWQ